jgi:sterol desaturase/sphingolipid hydroxylase (fatty acid hydroxylase superfamily)
VAGIQSEAIVRLACFAAVLLLMALWEVLAPRRSPSVSKGLRWASNIGLAFLNTIVVRVCFPLGLVSVALFAEDRAWGLFPNIDLPGWLAILLTVIILDFVIYVQHVVFHAVPLLWRLHMVHHADLDFDVTTGVRFHTIEIVLSLGIKAVAVLLLGPPAVAVLIFEALLNATSMFSHGNVRLPAPLDRVLRLLLVTPEMHRVHHSAIAAETNSNFGFNVPWWDYLFGTYRAQPEAGHEAMTIGLNQFRDERVEHLPAMLALPFVGDTGDYPVNRTGKYVPGKAHLPHSF